MLTAESPEIIDFLSAWHEHGRKLHIRQYPTTDYDFSEKKTAHTRRAYVACDIGPRLETRRGQFLVDRLTHNVYKIKSAYGVKGYFCGTLESLTDRYREATR